MPLHDGGDVVYMQESDTCPQTLWATSAYRALDHLVMLALDGCKGAKIWIARTGNYHEKKSAEAYRRVFRENSRGGRVLVFAQPLPAIFRYRSEVRL